MEIVHEPQKLKIAHSHQIKGFVWILLIGLFVWKCYDVVMSDKAYRQELHVQQEQDRVSDERWDEIKVRTAQIREQFAMMDSNERIAGKVESKDVLDDFGRVEKHIQYVRPLSKEHGDLEYVTTVADGDFVFKVTAGKTGFLNIAFGKKVAFDFDGVTKIYTMTLCGRDLCIPSSTEFAEDLKKVSTLRAAIPYDAGDEIVTYNVIQFKDLVK